MLGAAEIAAPATLPSPRAEALWQRRLAIEAARNVHAGDEDRLHGPLDAVVYGALRVSLRALGLYGRGLRNALSPVWRQYECPLPGLPSALDGLCILHLSDFHFRRADRPLAEAIRNLIRGTEADLAVLTGDYRYGYAGPVDHVRVHLAHALEGVRARHGVYAVLGNHDTSRIVPELQALGIRVLINEGEALRIRDAALWIGGVDDHHSYRCASVADALAGAPTDALRVALLHSPEGAAEAAALGAQLCLCGHTHAGQIRFPGLGIVKANARCPRAWMWGAWQCGAMRGFTSAGLGSTDVRVRYHCPPEALMIRLRRA